MQIHIHAGDQRLELREGSAVLRSFPVSTSALGLGTEPGSYKTPTGRFRISEKIGEGAPLGAVFKGRVPTGELGADATEGDLILTRILRLDGLDEANANTRERYIYIHGTNHEALVGTAASHGCVRMRNQDIVELFGLVESGAEVFIQPGASVSTK